MIIDTSTAEMVILIALFVVLLNVILFFKIWGMTNNVRNIKELVKEWIDIEHPIIKDSEKENEQ